MELVFWIVMSCSLVEPNWCSMIIAAAGSSKTKVYIYMATMRHIPEFINLDNYMPSRRSIILLSVWFSLFNHLKPSGH